MKPWSIGSRALVAPTSRALSAKASTSARSSADTQMIASVALLASTTCLSVKSAKRGSTRSITYASSLTFMPDAVSSVIRGSNSNPSEPKNFFDASRSLTGTFTKIMRDMRSSSSGGGLSEG
jgi:hypothetical protein